MPIVQSMGVVFDSFTRDLVFFHRALFKSESNGSLSSLNILIAQS